MPTERLELISASSRSISWVLDGLEGQLSLSRENPAETWNSESFFSQPLEGNWLHLAATLDLVSGEAIHYFNGREIGTAKAKTSTNAVSIEEIHLGDPAGKGALGEIWLYKTALSSGEIAQLYRAGSPR